MVAIGILLARNKIMQPLILRYYRIRGFSDNHGNARPITNNARYQSVVDFYSGKSVFVTGSTGFCGKVLVERLLRNCPGLDKMYLLIRGKHGNSANERLGDIFANPLFASIKNTNPHNFEKVVAVNGDLMLPKLGINDEDERRLIDNVSVVFHVAANVMFNEPMSTPMKINFEGTRMVLDLCKRIKNMKGFVHVSTAFAHTQRPILSEKIYPAPATVEDIYKFIDKYDSNKQETKKFLRRRPSTYCLVKALMETDIAENHGDVPTAIVRPSIVSPTIDGPVKGWCDNWHGASFLFYNVANGWDRITLSPKDNVCDIIPVDYVTNLSIVAGAKINGSRDVQVYNSTSSAENPITWREAYKYIIRESVYSEYSQLPFPFLVYTKSKILAEVVTNLQLISAYIADVWLRIKGKEPTYAKIISHAIRIRKGYNYYSLNSWFMEADRTIELFSKMSPEDQKRFPFNPTHINWPEYMKSYFYGIHQYLVPKYSIKNNKKSF